MVNEVVMYQSMFLLGVIMFGFFATSFNNYSDFADSVTLDNNLDRVLQEIAQEILNLLDRAAELRGNSDSITMRVTISLADEYATEPYVISFDPISTTDAILIATVNSDTISTLPLNVPRSSTSDFSQRTIEFTGQLLSSSVNTQIIYDYDGITESIILVS